MNRFPWANAMEIGLGRLRLSPCDFWAMTLPELAHAARGAGLGGGAGVMTRQALEGLAAQFPDCERSGERHERD
jgi:uncharacterized phage protein (TIGR02216 family)